MPTVSTTPSAAVRLTKLAALISRLKTVVPGAKLLGNGAAAKSGALGSLLDNTTARAALDGALAEQIFLDENGTKRTHAELDRMAGFSRLTPSQRYLIEVGGNATGTAFAKAQATAKKARLFLADDVNYDATGELFGTPNFRVIYNDVVANSGLGVSDLITDESEASKLSTNPAKQAKHVWLYLCVGEVEDFRSDVFDAAESAGLVASPNSSDPTGNNNVRFWDPKWGDILAKHMKAIWKTHSAKQPLAGFMLDVVDAWMRPTDTWD